MARTITISTIENILNCLGNIMLEPKIFATIENKLRSECRDNRFSLFVEAAANKSAIFKFMNRKYYVYYDYCMHKWKAEYN